MNIKELSIGDWVRHTFYEENVRIARIDGDSERVLAERGKLSISCHLNHFEPIPLTPEILEKNGWKEYSDYHNSWKFDVADYTSVWMFKNSHDWTFQVMHWGLGYNRCTAKAYIHHVHQLQHALRLAGIDKEIEL